LWKRANKYILNEVAFFSGLLLLKASKSETRDMKLRANRRISKIRNMLSRLATAIGLGALTFQKRTTAVATTVTAGFACTQTRIEANDQWQRLSGCLSSAVERTAEVRNHQLAASAQLDAATYALQTLKAELATIVPLSVDAVPPPALVVTRATVELNTFRRRKSIAA
jgi:hypothetical protein